MPRFAVARRCLCSSHDDAPACAEFNSIEAILKKHLPPKEYDQAIGVLFGLNGGQPVRELPVSILAAGIAEKENFDVRVHKVGTVIGSVRNHKSRAI